MNKVKFEAKIKEGHIVVTLGLSETNHLYWAMTTEETGAFGRDEGGGAYSAETILALALPDQFTDRQIEFIKLVGSLHLSDGDSGEPMYSIDNGLYYIKHPDEFKPAVTQKHLRITDAELETVIGLDIKSKLDYAEVIGRFDLRNRWKAESDLALKELTYFSKK